MNVYRVKVRGVALVTADNREEAELCTQEKLEQVATFDELNVVTFEKVSEEEIKWLNEGYDKGFIGGIR